MPVSDENPPPPILERLEALLARNWQVLLVAAFVFLVAGFALKSAAGGEADVPSRAELVTELRDVYRPWQGGQPGTRGFCDAVVHHPQGAALWWKLLWARVNGAWEPRLLAVADAVLQTLALLALWALVVRSTRRFAAGAATLGALAVFILAGPAGEPGAPSQSWWWGLLLFSSLHVGLAVGSRPTRVPWWIGQLAGACNVATSAAGLASPLALLAWAILGARDRATVRRAAPEAVVSVAMIAVGLILASMRGDPWLRGAFSGDLLQVLGWPWSGALGVLFVNLPVAAQLVRLFVRGAGDATPPPGGSKAAAPSHDRKLLGLCLLLPALAVAAAAFGPATGAIHDFVLLVNLVAAADLAERSLRNRPWVIVAGGMWGCLIVAGLVHTHPPRATRATRLEQAQATAASVRRFLVTNDRAALGKVFGLEGPQLEEAAGLLADPRVREFLPLSMRAPLALRPAGDDATFRAGEVPLLFGHPDDLTLWSSWSADGTARTGEWQSAPVATRFSRLQVSIAGVLAPPATTLVLRTADGREIPPLDERKIADDVWKRVNFVAPAGEPFTVVARATEPGTWLAFSEPLEWGGAAWLARRITAAAPWSIVVGLLCLTHAVIGLADRFRARGPGADDAAPHPAFALLRVLPWLALLLYVAVLSDYVDDNAAGSDSAGYLNGARLLMEGRLTADARMVPGLDVRFDAYLPLGFSAAGAGQMAPTYPLGVPLVFALVGKLSSLEYAIPFVILGQLVLGIWFTQRLALACDLPGAWAWLAAALVACNPVYVFMGLQPMSDGPSLVWVTAALLGAVRGRDDPRFAALAGLATAFAVMVRPANVLCLVPVAIVLGASWRRLGWWILGGLPGAIVQFWLNARLFGNPFMTGYGDPSNLFAWAWVWPTLGHFALWLPALATPLVVFAFVGVAVRRVALSVRLALVTCVTAYFGFYAFYFFSHEAWWYLRFVMPVFPPLAVLTVFGLRAAAGRLGWRVMELHGSRRAIASTLILALVPVAGLLFWANRLSVLRAAEGNSIYRASALWAERHVPAGAVVMCMQTSGSLFHYTSLTLFRYESMPPVELAAALRDLERLGRPVYAVLLTTELQDARSRLVGRWSEVGVVQHAKIWRLDAAPGLEEGNHAP